jgi:hypothetical protein
LQVLLFQDESRYQEINREIRDDDVQRELDQIGFERIPIVFVDTGKPEEIEHKINDPEEDVKPHRDSEF